MDFDTGITTSNGGLNAPISDMVRYLAFLMGAGDREVNDLVLGRESLDLDPLARAAGIAAFNTVGDQKPDIDIPFGALRVRLFGTLFPLFRRKGAAHT